MNQGHVKWFNDAKGFGFIEMEDGVNVFVHYTAIKGMRGAHKTLNIGQKVRFDMYEGWKGFLARNVTRVEQ